VIDTVPSPAARMGNLCSVPGTPSVCTPTTVTVDPSAAKYLALYPLPNGPLRAGGDTGTFATATKQAVNENYFTTRIDHKISDKDSLFGTFLYDTTPFTTPDLLNNVVVGSETRRKIVALEETHIFSSRLANSFRFGYNRDAVSNLESFTAINPAAADASLGAVPGAYAAAVSIGGGLTKMSGGLARLLHEEVTWVVPEGIVHTKREVLAKLPELAALSGANTEVSERTYGQVAVRQVHSGQAHGLRVWITNSEGWQLFHVGEIVQPLRSEVTATRIETPCVNPCTTVPFHPESSAEHVVLTSWQEMEIGAYKHIGADWGAHAADEFLVVSSWSNKPQTKLDRVAAYNKLRENGVHTNTVAPLVWAHMWEFGDTIFMIAEHTRYGGKPDIASRVWVNRDGRWLLAVSYHTIVKAMPVLTFQTTAPE
jgi:hypothetical protein